MNWEFIILLPMILMAALYIRGLYRLRDRRVIRFLRGKMLTFAFGWLDVDTCLEFADGLAECGAFRRAHDAASAYDDGGGSAAGARNPFTDHVGSSTVSAQQCRAVV